MGQVNSASGEAAGLENGRRGMCFGDSVNGTSMPAEDRTDDQVKCVKARIDMLIEDCLNREPMSDREPERTLKTEVKHEVKCVENKTFKSDSEQSDNHKDFSTDGGTDKCGTPVKVENLDNVKKESVNQGENSDKSGKNENCQNHGRSEERPQDGETNSGKNEHVKVSDIISEMVSTEITQTHLTQLQKRTITTFNTFIDKVLDTTLQQEMSQEEIKTTEPSIIQLFTESLLPANDQSASRNTKEMEKTHTSYSANQEIVKMKGVRKITLKDHIEKLLEESIHNDETDLHEQEQSKDQKPVKMEKFNAQGLLNNIIVQGLKMTDTNVSKEPLKMETQRPVLDGYSQKHYKPNEKTRGHSQFQTDIHRQRSPVPNMNPRREVNEMRSNRATQMEQQALATEARYKEMYMNRGRNELRPDSRDMYNHPGYQGRRHSMSERSREAFALGAANKQLPNNMRNTDSTSAFHQLHPAYANPEYYKAAYAAIGSLSPGQSMDPRSNPGREGKPPNYHPRDCTCALCVQSVRNKFEQPVVDPHRDKRSPILPPHLAGLPAQYRDSPAMMRPGHGAVPVTYSQYQSFVKLLPHHSPITSPKEGGHLGPPGDMAMMQGRRPSISESPASPHYMYKRNEDNIQYDRSASKTAPHLNIGWPPSGQRPREKEYTRTLSSQSGSSDNSDTPLDLSVKKPDMEQSRHRSASFHVSSQRRAMPMNSFIKHLENSVDKHWQEMSSPSSSPGNSSSPKSHHLTPDGRGMSQVPYQGHSPNAVSPSGSVAMLHNRHLPSPHFTGGITVGQPLVNTRATPEAQFPPSSQYDNFPVSQSQTHFAGNQQSFDSNRASADNVSKHEPIQNIIGNHDPNDILYLICRLCTQTYGSPYAFRKHFRSNHGFEPRADHTIVQTISATKMALHLPQPFDIQGQANLRKSPHEKSRMSPQVVPVPTPRKTPTANNQSINKPLSSPVETKSQTSSEDGDFEIAQKMDNTGHKTETKCLECPECGKTFQLNDFGSYKRHCRQHGNLLTSGPFTCTDCHLHFPDQKALREHYLMHVKESSLDHKDDKKSNDSNLSDGKLESHQTCYSCVKCNSQFDNMNAYNKHLATHESSDDEKSVKHSEKSDKVASVAKEVNKARMDISVNMASSPNIVIQAAESMTAQMCPDSSWDNVVKGIATSNKPDETSSEMAESKNSPGSDNTATNKSDERSENSPALRNTDIGSDASDANTQDSADMGIYKHKKFFHHRKRANSNLSQDSSSESKRTKLSIDSNSTTGAPITSTSKVFNVNNDSCDSSGFSDTGSNTSSMTETAVAANVKEKKDEKSAKTEARHNLPFVWDRPTRSQKKL